MQYLCTITCPMQYRIIVKCTIAKINFLILYKSKQSEKKWAKNVTLRCQNPTIRLSMDSPGLQQSVLRWFGPRFFWAIIYTAIFVQYFALQCPGSEQGRPWGPFLRVHLKMAIKKTNLVQYWFSGVRLVAEINFLLSKEEDTSNWHFSKEIKSWQVGPKHVCARKTRTC